MSKALPRISESEWRIMKILWDDAPKTAHEVVEMLSETTTWKPKTIKTLLHRLVNKKALAFDKRGKSYLYYPLVKEEVCARFEREVFVNRVYGGALRPMFAAFIEDYHLTAAEIDDLKRILEKGRR